MSSNKDFDIIVPVFNEYENLHEFINILEEKNINLIKRFTFVDNGSSDIRIYHFFQIEKQISYT